MLAASPRAARGVGQKAERQAIYQLRRKGIVPNVRREAAKEILNELKRGPLQEKPWEKAMRERNELERKTYLEEAQRLRTKAAEKEIKQDQRKQQFLLRAAADLERFARTMSKAKSKRQATVEKATTKAPVKSKGADQGLER